MGIYDWKQATTQELLREIAEFVQNWEDDKMTPADYEAKNHLTNLVNRVIAVETGHTETGTCYLIECRTGCTCCADENHYRGPFTTREIAQKAAEAYEQIPLLASQFAARGRYTIEEASFEKLPDGRMVINGDRIWTEGFQDECLGLTERYE